MGEIVNLRKARKAQARTAKEATATENRARFGRTGSEKARDREEAARARQLLDGHRRDGGGEDA